MINARAGGPPGSEGSLMGVPGKFLKKLKIFLDGLRVVFSCEFEGIRLMYRSVLRFNVTFHGKGEIPINRYMSEFIMLIRCIHCRIKSRW